MMLRLMLISGAIALVTIEPLTVMLAAADRQGRSTPNRKTRKTRRERHKSSAHFC